MKLIERMIDAGIDNDFGECMEGLGEVAPDIPVVHRFVVSLWWGRKLPNFVRPIVARIIERDI